MIILGKHTIDEVKSCVIDEFEYAPVKPEYVWKGDMVKNLLRTGLIKVPLRTSLKINLKTFWNNCA